MTRFLLLAGALALGALPPGADARPRTEPSMARPASDGVVLAASFWRSEIVTQPEDRCHQGPPSARGKTATMTIWTCLRPDGKLQRDYYTAAGYLYSLVQV